MAIIYTILILFGAFIVLVVLYGIMNLLGRLYYHIKKYYEKPDLNEYIQAGSLVLALIVLIIVAIWLAYNVALQINT
jgi:hypothetical protein